MDKCKKFVMWLEPHMPDGKNKCAECVLSKGPMCLDRSYCKLKKTGKTWRRCSNPPKSEAKEATKSTSTNKLSTSLPTFVAFEFFMKANKNLTNQDIYDYLTGNGEHS